MLPTLSKTSAVFTIFCLLGTLASCSTSNAQKQTLGQQIPASQQVSMAQIDHRSWDAILKAFVNQKGQVNYAGLKASPDANQALDQYLNHLSSASLNRPADKNSKLAFWINAYNAVTVKGILQHYPTTSIKNHVSNFGGYNIWKDLKIQVGDQTFSLDDIEHKRLRKMNEPRIHFAIVCASISCPRLLNQAYVGPQLEQQLTANAKDFFANPTNFRYDGRNFQLSKILSWFGDDFGSEPSSRLRAIAPYLPTQAAQDAASQNKAAISFISYDWGLNEYKPAHSQPLLQPSSQGSGQR
jgi:hypothetical protein